MTGPHISRRQFVTASGVISLAGSALAFAEASEQEAQAEATSEYLYENTPLQVGHDPLTLSPQRTFLAIIDMQRYFVNLDYPFARTLEKLEPGCTAYYFKRVREVVIPNCQRLQRCFRSFGTNIIYTLFGSLRADGNDMPRWARQDNVMGRNVVGTPIFPPVDDPSSQVDDSLQPAPGELVVPKNTSGPLNSTKLDQMLRTLGIDTLVVTGVVTNVCVTQTAREFADRDFRVVVVEDACATLTEKHHHASLGSFNVFGNVCKTDSVVKMISGKG